MPVLREIKNIKIEDEFQYALHADMNGFHTSFLNLNAGKDSPVKSTREVYQVILICPECGARYDVGWRVSFTESETRVVRTTGIRYPPYRPDGPIFLRRCTDPYLLKTGEIRVIHENTPGFCSDGRSRPGTF